MGRALPGLLIGAAALLLALPLPAQAVNRLALVIGNDRYQAVESLKNAGNDAQLMARTLQDARFDVRLVLNADRKRFYSEIDALHKRIAKGDEVVFFFAGHGVQIGSNPVLLPTDIRAEGEREVEREGVPLLYVQDALQDARVSLLVIDACRDNPFKGTRSIGASRGLIPPEASRGQAIILSAGRGQKALDLVPGQAVNNGLFTHEFVQVIRQPGLDVRSALVQVRDKVEDRAARDNHPQRPSLVDDLRGNFYIFVAPGGSVTINPPQPAARPALSAEQIEDQAWEDAARADSLAAYEAYLREYPKGRYARRARIRIVALRSPGPPPPPAATTAASPPVVLSAPAAWEPRMLNIPAGSFLMGSPENEKGRDVSEGPQHTVRVAAFQLSQTEVTVGQFRHFVQASGYKTEAERNIGSQPGCLAFEDSKHRADRDWRNPGFAQSDAHPVVCVSWNDAQAYVRWLAQTTGKAYRLPSEAEWEYAARAGTSTRFHWGEDESTSATCRYANVGDRTAKRNYEKLPISANCDDGFVYTAPVGGRKANGWGLNDVLGNVWELTEDCWNDNYKGAPTDGSVWRVGDCSVRVVRGGGWADPFHLPRSAVRNADSVSSRDNITGFRVARTLP